MKPSPIVGGDAKKLCKRAREGKFCGLLSVLLRATKIVKKITTKVLSNSHQTLLESILRQHPDIFMIYTAVHVLASVKVKAIKVKISSNILGQFDAEVQGWLVSGALCGQQVISYFQTIYISPSLPPAADPYIAMQCIYFPFPSFSNHDF